MSEKTAKYTGQDTVFRDMFSQKKYLLQLYRALHPEDTDIKATDLNIVTLQTILLNGIYNDLGFMVRGDKLLILLEAQTTWSPNIIIRSLMYLMNTYQEYFDKNKIQLYGSVKVDIPKPELYVVYTKEKANHPDVLSLAEEFFSNKDCCIDARIKVIYANDTDDILNQYIGFCKVFTDTIKVHGRTLKAVKEIVRICRNKNLLKDYLTERKTEVEGIMLTLFNQERVFDIEKNRLLEQGREEGIARGKLFSIKSMMKNLKISAEQAMEILEIPRSDFAKYMTLL